MLAALRPLEHELLPQAVRLFARGALVADAENPRRIAASRGTRARLSRMAPNSDVISPGSGLERAAPGEVRVRRALLSVSDKHGLVDFARGLAELGVELVSTGGTARELAGAGIAVRAIEDFTGFPEIMDGRVKTLHPRLYAGLLARRDEEPHLRAAAEQQIEPVDLVCVNLYPFEQTVARGDADEAEVIENIDIGGPTMIRAAAKNSDFAAVVVDPADYAPVLEELRELRGQALAGHAQAPGGERVRLHRPLRRGDLALVRASARPRTSRQRWASAYEKVERPALRREPPPARGLLRRGRRAPRTCSTASSSCTARSCRSTTCST